MGYAPTTTRTNNPLLHLCTPPFFCVAFPSPTLARARQPQSSIDDAPPSLHLTQSRPGSPHVRHRGHRLASADPTHSHCSWRQSALNETVTNPGYHSYSAATAQASAIASHASRSDTPHYPHLPPPLDPLPNSPFSRPIDALPEVVDDGIVRVTRLGASRSILGAA
ncbi:hypothetical protein NMY22_g5729 [Coprinellus aureogranulatus]|nr:hypothetical protein NMY22_g5729 [Coprinellus aureogranulatus]